MIAAKAVGLLIGVPFRLAFCLSPDSRHTLSLALDGWAGKERSHPAAGFSGYLAIGLSYELR